MAKTPDDKVAQSQPRHFAEEALRELELVAAEWIARQRERVTAAS